MPGSTLAEQRLRYWGAALSVAAGLIHGGLVEEHLREWWGYGLFFAFAAIAQLFFGVLLLLQPWQPSRYAPAPRNPALLKRRFYQAGVAGNAAVVLLYLMTRTVGIPFFGPEAGRVEPVTNLSLVSKAIELVLIAVLLRLLRSTPETPVSPARAPLRAAGEVEAEGPQRKE